MNENDTSDVFVSKFDINGRYKYAKIKWKHEHDLFQIRLFDDDTTWTGRYSNDFAKKFRERVDETEEEYSTNVKIALSGEHPLYSYDLIYSECDNETSTFRWHKKYGDALLVHGCVPLHPDDVPESKDVLLDILLSQNKQHRSTIHNLIKMNKELDVDLGKCKQELEQFVNIKTSLETSLYGKFVELLNAKKRRIQLLEDNLHKYEKSNKSPGYNELD